MSDDSVLEEIQDNTREAGQRLRASLNLMRSQGMLDDGNYRELITRLSTALAMVGRRILRLLGGVSCNDLACLSIGVMPKESKQQKSLICVMRVMVVGV